MCNFITLWRHKEPAKDAKFSGWYDTLFFYAGFSLPMNAGCGAIWYPTLLLAYTAPVGVAMAMRRCSQRLAYREADTRTGRRMGPVVLVERAYGADRLADKIDEGKGVVAFAPSHLLQVAVPQL